MTNNDGLYKNPDNPEQVLQGAYVAAWVWIELNRDACLDDNDKPVDRETLDNVARAVARDVHARDGEIEIDDAAVVSLSYDDDDPSDL